MVVWRITREGGEDRKLLVPRRVIGYKDMDLNKTTLFEITSQYGEVLSVLSEGMETRNRMFCGSFTNMKPPPKDGDGLITCLFK